MVSNESLTNKQFLEYYELLSGKISGVKGKDKLLGSIIYGSGKGLFSPYLLSVAGPCRSYAR